MLATVSSYGGRRGHSRIAPFPSPTLPPAPIQSPASPRVQLAPPLQNREGKASPLRPLPNLIFASRWLQLPLYLGLIVAQGVYVVHFLVELLHLVEAAFGSEQALKSLITSIGYKTTAPVTTLNETVIMLVVLALIDVVMISNLLIMVIIGGYETFVSRMNLEGHRDQPEWLSHVNASVLKVKLATAIIGISSIHLLKTFINADNYTDRVLIAQTAIHIAFLLSAMAIAYTDRLMAPPPGADH
ncbi:YqhA family protein [Variovorax sp. KK3]|uniref:YqhA family protein n=1 Tax=Variovorax sp. KK3 TaxID=1855728 RepID=UPI003AAB8DC7